MIKTLILGYIVLLGIDAGFGAATGALMGTFKGPQKSMIQDITDRAGEKALKKGITFGYAALRTTKREFKNFGSSLIEEAFTSFVAWFTGETVKKWVGL